MGNGHLNVAGAMGRGLICAELLSQLHGEDGGWQVADYHAALPRIVTAIRPYSTFDFCVVFFVVCL